MDVTHSTLCHRVAQEIADAIIVNCDRHLEGTIDRETWDREQVRLWRLAMRNDCSDAVMRIVAPMLIQHSRESR